MPRNFKQFVATGTRPLGKADAVRAFLKSIGAQYVNEYELIRAAHVAAIDLPQYREHFAAHVVPYRNSAGKQGFLWAGTPKLAKQMREVSK